METKSIMIVGVGGQGTLLSSRLLGAVLTTKGYDVKVSEVHGMSQRGGSVVTYVRYGKDPVYSPVIAEGSADIIMAFDECSEYGYNHAQAEAAMKIVNDFDPEKFGAVTDFAKALNGGRPISQ